MMLDVVHDVQTLYRLTLDAMSRPGTIVSLEPYTAKLGSAVTGNPSSALLAYMLLDVDVCHAVVSAPAPTDPIHQWIHEMTYSRATSMDEADYIFIRKDASQAEAEQAIARAKCGDLISPHTSATIILEVDHISNEPTYAFRGPGVQDTTSVHVATEVDWVRCRQVNNVEYPMGVDMILVDAHHRLIAIPRTTQVESQVSKTWHT